MKRNTGMIREKDGIRGLVPSRDQGSRDKQYGIYLQALDPRANDRLKTALARQKDPRFVEFLERIATPKYKRVALQTIAKGCGIDLAEFQKFWQRESSQEAIAIAQVASVQIAEDMAEDARSVAAVCPRCDGLAFVAAPPGLPRTVKGYKEIRDGSTEKKYIRDCPNCGGSGEIRKAGDTHARDRIMEIGGILQKGKAGVSIVQNFGLVSHSSVISQLDNDMTIDGVAEEIIDVQ